MGLRDGLKKSTAEWRIVITHFPGVTIAEKLGPEFVNDVDLLFTGHTHYQYIGNALGCDYVISGGGGGVTSDSSPTKSGHDNAYGFVDFTISRSNLDIQLFTWGGPNAEEIVFARRNLKPKKRSISIVEMTEEEVTVV